MSSLQKDLKFKELYGKSWVTDLSFFLVHITHHLISVTLLLQGVNQIVTQLYDYVQL